MGRVIGLVKPKGDKPAKDVKPKGDKPAKDVKPKGDKENANK